MGKRGQQSKKGIGEIDDSPRRNKFLCRFPDDIKVLLESLSQLLKKSKNQIIVESIRFYARYHTSVDRKPSDNTDK